MKKDWNWYYLNQIWNSMIDVSWIHFVNMFDCFIKSKILDGAVRYFQIKKDTSVVEVYWDKGETLSYLIFNWIVPSPYSLSLLVYYCFWKNFLNIFNVGVVLVVIYGRIGSKLERGGYYSIF